MNQEPKPLHITQLEIENVKAITVARITPSGRIVEIAGDNGQGKTSLMDSIALAFENTKAGVDEPVRHGADEAHVSVDVGEFKVTRSWTKGGENSYLTVRTADGQKPPRPQDFLNALYGSVAFDPLRFANMKGPERRDALLKMVPLKVDLAKLAGQRAAFYEDRTVAGRKVAELEAQLKALPEQEGGPEEEVSIALLTARLGDVHRENAETDRIVASVERLRQESAALTLRIERIRHELTAAETELAEKQRALAVEEGRLNGREVQSPAAVQAEIDAAGATNAAIRDRNRKREEREALAAKLEAARVEWQRCEGGILGVDRQKAEALAQAPMPVAGLSLTDDDVTLNDVPFGDLAMSEKLKVGLALGLTASPRLRVALVRDGSLLDERSRGILADWAEKFDAQVWVEVVGNGGDGAFVIKAGAIVGQEAEPAAVGGAR